MRDESGRDKKGGGVRGVREVYTLCGVLVYFTKKILNFY